LNNWGVFEFLYLTGVDIYIRPFQHIAKRSIKPCKDETINTSNIL